MAPTIPKPLHKLSGDPQSAPDRSFTASLPSQSKVITFIRHGQGFHNVAGHQDPANYNSESLFDAYLTRKGWQQAASLRSHLAKSSAPPPQLVVVSPLTRALETAVGVYGGDDAASPGPSDSILMHSQTAEEGKRTDHPAVLSPGSLPFLACELARETIGEHPCDRRRPTSHYQEHFPGVDFSQVEHEEDVFWEPDVRETRAEIDARGRRLVSWLMQRPEQIIAVVAHSGLLSATMRQWEGSSAAAQAMNAHFANCEMRTVIVSGSEAVHQAPARDSLGCSFIPADAPDAAL